MAGQARLTVDQIDHALKQASGNVTYAAKALGVARGTLYRRIGQNARLQETLTDARESLVDAAESALHKQILDGNIAAIIFALKTLGKDRGYVERTQQEITGRDGGAVTIRIEGVIDDAGDGDE